MRLKKLFLILIVSTFLLTALTTKTMAVSNTDLPWDWIHVGIKDEDVFLGIGTRDPNLSDNIGLEFGASFNDDKVSPGLDLLYFFDPSASFSLNVGIGVFADNNGSTTEYSTTYSGGVWFHLGDTILGVGYHSCRGIALRCGLWF